MNYATMNLFFTAFTVLLVAATWRLPKFGRRMLASLLAAAMLCALTAVFDSLMIYLDLFDYPDSSLLDIRVGLAPIEDFSYPICAAFGVPALMTLLTGASSRGAGD